MKTLFGLSLLTLSLSTLAFEQKAHLDFTSVYDNFNAGSYVSTVKLQSKASVSKAVIETSIERDDNDLFCTTTAKFEIGEMNFALVSTDKKWESKSTQKVYGFVTHRVEGSECDLSLDNLSGEKLLFVQVSLKGPIQLPVVAPYDYQKVSAWLTPFAGYLYANTTIKFANGELVIDPSGLLTRESVYPLNNENGSKYYYYVTATKESTTLSLATGSAEFQ